METNRISIIVPIFKVEKYLYRCIDSLIIQDYSDIEIILVDDGSPDRCGDICDDYAKKDDRIKVIHKKNGGLSSARNRGLDIATGSYIMCVDSDDYVEKNFCSYALEKALQTQADIVVFGYNDVYERHVEIQSVSQGERYGVEEALAELHGGKLLSFAWNKIYKAKLFDGIRYPEGRLFEDVGTTYKLFDKANFIYHASGVTYNYQKRGDSILGKSLSPKGAIDWFEMDMERLEFLKMKYPNMVNRQLLDFYVKDVLRFYNTIVGRRGYKQEKKEMETFLITNKDTLFGKKSVNRAFLIYHTPRLYHLMMKAYRLFGRA